jgi:hypothetical protein
MTAGAPVATLSLSPGCGRLREAVRTLAPDDEQARRSRLLLRDEWSSL